MTPSNPAQSETLLPTLAMIEAGVERAESFGWEHFGGDDAREIYLAMEAVRPLPEPQQDVVTAVAKALFKVRHPAGDWAKVTDTQYDLFRIEARAAIQALQVPELVEGDLRYIEHLRLMASREREAQDAGEWISANASAMQVVKLLDKLLPALPQPPEKSNG